MTPIVPLRNMAQILAATSMLIASAASAQDASPWVRDSHSAMRLIAGSRSGPALLGGIAFDIQRGWKTYWRMPGDSGVPPRFDFSKSENIDDVKVLWPAPTKFPDGAGGESLGYHEKVVLPLRIDVKDSTKPAVLRASVNYAVCEKLCIPVAAETELTFTSVASPQDATLRDALNRVPKPANVGDANSLAIKSVKREGKSEVVVDVVAPPEKSINLFVEGPTTDWALPIPHQVDGAPPGLIRFSFELEGVPPGAAIEGAALKFTLVSGDTAYEIDTTLK